VTRPRYIRFAQDSFGASLWRPVALDSDANLAALGYALATAGRDTSALSDADNLSLWELSARPEKKLTDDERTRLAALLAQCPFAGPMFPIDIDVNDESATYEPDAARAAALAFARVIDRAIASLGFGRLAWSKTGAKGSMHGDQVAPGGVASPTLLRAYGEMAKRLAHEAGVPLRSDEIARVGSSKSKWAPVVIDDSNFQRFSTSKGSMWRLRGACKPGGFPKTPWSLATDAPDPNPVPPVPAPVDVVRDAIAFVEAREASEEKTARRRDRKPSTATGVWAAASDEDIAFVDASPRLKRLWSMSGAVDRSMREWSFAKACIINGADDDRIIRLLGAMPGDVKSRERGLDYMNHNIIGSAQRWLERNGPRIEAENAAEESRFREEKRTLGKTLAPEAKAATETLIATLHEHWPTVPEGDDDGNKLHREMALGLSGWFFKSGVPATLARTIFEKLPKGAGATPVVDMVRTTVEKARAGLRISGRNVFVRHLPSSAVVAVARYISLLGRLGVLSSEAIVDHAYELVRAEHEEEKGVWSEVAKVLRSHGHAKEADTACRASHCGDYHAAAACPECSHAHTTITLRCELEMCVWCGPKRRRSGVGWMRHNWMKGKTGARVAVAVVAIGDTSRAAAKKAQAKLSRAVAVTRKGMVRFMLTPGRVLAVTPIPEVLTDDWRDIDGEGIHNRALSVAIDEIDAAWESRHKWTRDFVRKVAEVHEASRESVILEGFESGWLYRAPVASGGRGLKEMPWPSKAVVRRAAKVEKERDRKAEARKLSESALPEFCETHGRRLLWHVVSLKTGAVVTEGHEKCPTLQTAMRADPDRIPTAIRKPIPKLIL
jgi:hypothetical protein